MARRNRRGEPRIGCEVPAHVFTEEGDPLPCTVVDVSRTGLRLRVEGHLLGLHRLSSLARVARTITEVLGGSVEAELNPEKLGPLLRRTMKPIRIAKRDWEHAYVELGCALDTTLCEEEAHMLGLALPPPVASTPAEGLHLVRADEAHRFEAVVLPAEGHSAPPLATRAEVITGSMAMLEVTDPEDQDLAQFDVASAIMTLHERYGAQVTVCLVEDGEDVWVGPAEITEVDVLQGERARMHIGIVFGRTLRPEELSRLGLPTPA